MGTLADHIEAYIKRMLRESQTNSIELSRAQLADSFACVPSQINYVLTTRFSLERGYVVESRRGGGGYIRVGRVHVEDRFAHAVHLLQSIGEELEERQMENILARFKDMQLIDQKEMRLIRGIIQQEVSTVGEGKELLRASLLRALLFWIIKSAG
ncbi:MAG TPA: CtsR family transcriptional regulator [Firmicutes bacterium]|nr:CtsR family transcriptional regulator [Bacillota bacterium]